MNKRRTKKLIGSLRLILPAILPEWLPKKGRYRREAQGILRNSISGYTNRQLIAIRKARSFSKALKIAWIYDRQELPNVQIIS